MILLEDPIRYPDNGRDFFHDKGSNDELAWLQKLFQEFGSYASGYQLGAIKLLDHALDEPRQRDFLVYPIVFLIRLYIELRLKELIQGLNYCQQQTKDFPSGHNILNLWNDFKIKYQAVGESIADDSFKAMDSIIYELGNTETISMSFRYPVDKDGNKIQKLETVNLTELRKTFIRVSYMFDGISMQIDHYVDITEGLMGEMYANNY
jgi:hypothetical protein